MRIKRNGHEITRNDTHAFKMNLCHLKINTSHIRTIVSYQRVRMKRNGHEITRNNTLAFKMNICLLKINTSHFRTIESYDAASVKNLNLTAVVQIIACS